MRLLPPGPSRTSTALRHLPLLLLLLTLSSAARAANYYWVGNGGAWTDLSHWASTSGGPGNAYLNVPKNTDNVFFDGNSFTLTERRVTITGTVTCNDMTWSGNVRQATLVVPGGSSGVLEVNGDLRYTATMSTLAAISVPHRLLATADVVVDTQGVPFGAGLTFDSGTGGWTFTSAFNGAAGTTVNISAARLVSFGSTTLSFSTLNTFSNATSTASTVAGTLDLGSSTTTLLTQTSAGALNLSNLNLTLVAGTSTISLGASALTTYVSPVSFTTGKAFAFNKVEVNSGNGALFNVANSSFATLNVNSRVTLGSAATIQPDGHLTVGADATLLVGTGASRVLSFGVGAWLATSGSCAGLGTIQSSQAGSPAILARSGGWAGMPLSYAVLQDLTFSDGSSGYPANGAAVATASADQGGNTGAVVSNLAVTDLYWVGGTGNWHDASHWASTSGGPGGTACVPNVFTNVHFDDKSFTPTSRVVTLDQAGQSCRNMDWTGADRSQVLNQALTPILNTASATTRASLTVAGSLKLIAGMSQVLPIDLFLGQGGGSCTLATAGQSLAAHLWFRAAGGSYSLLDDVTTTGRVFVESGTVTTSGYTVNAQSFSIGYGYNNSVYTTGTAQSSPVSLAAPTVNLGTSVLNLLGTNNRNDANAIVTNYAWDIASTAAGGVTTTAVTLNASSSTINMLNGNNTTNYYTYFRGGLGLTYGTVTFANNTTTATLPNVIGTPNTPSIPTVSTFQNLLFYGSAVIGSNNTFKGQLLLSAGKSYTFANGTTQTFNTGATFNAVGTCSNFITLAGTSVTRFVAASSVPLQYVTLQYAAFLGGAAWQDQGGVDGGGNSGIAIAPPPTRTLYWVGEGGNWSDAAHWSQTSGGAGGECSPSLVDNVFVDANSFTTPAQTLTIDQPSCTCRTLDCSAAGSGMTLRSVAGNVLSVYGSATWAAPASMSLALTGGLSFLGAGTTGTLTSAGQTLTGALTVNVPGGTVTLADNFASTAAIAHTAGTIATNDRTVSALTYATNNTTPKTLRLGASQVTINGTWTIVGGSLLTVVPGTSLLTVNSGTFNGYDQPYYDVVLNSAASTGTLSGSNTFHNLQLTGSTNVLGSNTISGTLTFFPGRAYVFSANTTTTFGTGATLASVGLSNNPVTLQSSVNGSLFTWTKASGGICADYTYIRDSRALGGAYFEAGRNGANNQGNNPGWSFGFVPRASYAGRTTCPAEGMHSLRLDFTAYDGTNNVSNLPLAAAQYPLAVRVTNLTTGTYEDVSVPATPYYYPIATSTATAQYQVTSVVTSANSGCGASANTDLSTFVVVTDALLAGPAGTWSGNGALADGNWLDCHNWAGGTVPTGATDVTISKNATTVSLGNGLTAAVAMQPALNGAGAVRTLTVPAGAALMLGNSAQLAVSGDWLNSGTVAPDAASQVTFQGTTTQTLTGGTFGSVAVNNAAGLVLTTDASTSGTLTFGVGKITTGNNKWVHGNPSAASLSGYGAGSYVAGNLRRAIAPGASVTYAFPVGTASQYALYELLDHNLGGAGFSALDARFGPKPGTDLYLNCLEWNCPTAYQSIHNSGVWTITPSAQPSTGTYDAKVSLLPFSGLTDNYFAILKRPDASTNAADWSSGGGTISVSGGAGRRVADGYALRRGLSSFSQFGLGQMLVAPLPVTLTSFQATASGLCGVRLDWTTASETQSDRFELERSLDGRTFSKLAAVASRNSLTGGHYTYLDQQPGEGLNYYRLRLVDLDNTSTYSTVATLPVACGSASAVTVAPNPATSSVRIGGLLAGQMLHVYGSDGRLVYAGTDQLLDVSSWATGLYLVHVGNADGGLAGTYKLLKQ